MTRRTARASGHDDHPWPALPHGTCFALPLATIRFALARRRQRRQLAELDDDRLKDIGVTREQAASEARKPFWKR